MRNIHLVALVAIALAAGAVAGAADAAAAGNGAAPGDHGGPVTRPGNIAPNGVDPCVRVNTGTGAVCL